MTIKSTYFTIQQSV